MEDEMKWNHERRKAAASAIGDILDLDDKRIDTFDGYGYAPGIIDLQCELEDLRTRIKVDAAVTASLKEERERLVSALKWANGEGEEFPVRQEGQGAYWWRKELSERAFGIVGPDVEG